MQRSNGSQDAFLRLLLYKLEFSATTEELKKTKLLTPSKYE